jgi:hypothetical protein
MATATFTDNGNCSVEVTYTWSGFKGSALMAEYGVLWPGEGGIHFALLFTFYPVSGSGTSSHTFDLTGRGTNTYSGFGLLINKQGKTLGGSDVSSATSADLSC